MNYKAACSISDSHNHIHLEKFNEDRDEVIERARQAGVEKMLLVGVDPEDSVMAVQ